MKQYIETNFYRGFVNFIKQYNIYFRGLPMDYKRNSLAKNIVDIVSDIIDANIESYSTQNEKRKLIYADKSIKLYNKLNIYINILADTEVFNVKQISVLSKQLGELGYQLENWKNKLISKIEPKI